MTEPLLVLGTQLRRGRLQIASPNARASGRRAGAGLVPSLLLSALTAAAGCAGLPRTSTGVLEQRSATPRRLAEEFDPKSYREDLLLIQPKFPRPSVASISTEAVPDDSAGVEADTATALGSEPSSQQSYSEPTFAGKSLYRVQVVALSKETGAAVLAGKLEMALNVPVVFEAQGGLFAVRAGEFATSSQAEELRDRIVALADDYGEAFVISGRRQIDVTVDAAVESLLADDLPWESSALDEPEEEPEVLQPPELVLVDGWRVLIDQFLTFAEAERLRQRAMRGLGRSDIVIDFKEPYYKVEVGAFRRESEAQAAMEQIWNRGYRSALRVRAQIFVPKEEL